MNDLHRHITGTAPNGSRRRHKAGPLALLVLTLLSTLVTGCWDRLEIEERAMILGIAIDKAPDNKIEQSKNLTYFGDPPVTKSPPLQVTLQLAVPGRIPLGPSESGGGSGPGQKPVWIHSATGLTIDDAFNTIQQEVPHKLFWGHVRVIAISKEVAETGLTNINEYLRRNPDVRRTTWMIVTEGDAGAYMRITPQLERVPILYLLSTMDHAVQMGKLPNAFAGVFWSAASSKGTDPFLVYTRLVKDNSVQIAGLALFRSDRLVETTEPLDIGVFMGIRNLQEGGYSTLATIPGSNTAIMYQVTHRKARIDVAIVGDKPEIHVKIHNEGNLKEKSNEEVQLSPEVISEIEKNMSKYTPDYYKKLIRKTQQKGADIFGFGEYVRAKQPSYWNKEIGTKDKWEELYKHIKVEVQVTNSIRRVGGKIT
ncbi:Ger(x)C family spore germination protein [Paenibacillus ginsengarvi]|uniref:Ger(x)C family spore germination protein n=1 Tax=Paenibacillus ginsengarvi TaxID=400777 RepID=UPI001F01EEA6|nr:Ger(x)C family spore germination protein [Paenibacillus ginsengarvi]